MEKLSQVPGLPFTQVAADAYSRGRPRLAALLLDYETRSSEQARGVLIVYSFLVIDPFDMLSHAAVRRCRRLVVH